MKKWVNSAKRNKKNEKHIFKLVMVIVMWFYFRDHYCFSVQVGSSQKGGEGQVKNAILVKLSLIGSVKKQAE